MLDQKPFTKYNEEKKVDSVSLRFNEEERKQLEEDKKILEQTKDSTAIKQLASIGSKVLHDRLFGDIIGEVLGNRRKNKRLGVADFE